MHKKKTTPFKERTLYMRSKYVIPKKAQLVYDKNSSIGSSTGSRNNQNDELFLYDISRHYSSRLIEMKDYDEGDYLAGATPKPKKKIKLEATSSLNL